MFIITAKLDKKKAVAAIVALAVLLTAVILFAGSRGRDKDEAAMGSIEDMKVKTNLDRMDFLKKFGWEVEEKAIEEKEVVIPREFDDVYTQYNALQMAQGFDLSQYKGVTAIRYTYEVKNYPTQNGKVVADMIVCKDKVIAGSVQSTAADGFMHGFSIPE